MYFSVSFIFKLGMEHWGVPVLFQDNLGMGQGLLNFRRFHLVALRSQGFLLTNFLTDFPSLCLPVTPEPCPGSMQGFLIFRRVPELTQFWILFQTGDVSGWRVRKFSWLHTTTFEVKSTHGHPSNTNTATKRHRNTALNYILGLKSPSSFPLGPAAFLAEGTEAAASQNCVVWAVFKWKTPGAENVASLMPARNNNRVMQSKLYPFTENMRDAVMPKSISH